MRFRYKNQPTNVISFPFKDKFIKNIKFIGDLVICNKIIENESINLKKDLLSHWCHIIIHGFLHLLGYDHYTKNQRKNMELIEIEIMNSMGYSNPYII